MTRRQGLQKAIDVLKEVKPEEWCQGRMFDGKKACAVWHLIRSADPDERKKMAIASCDVLAHCYSIGNSEGMDMARRNDAFDLPSVIRYLESLLAQELDVVAEAEAIAAQAMDREVVAVP